MDRRQFLGRAAVGAVSVPVGAVSVPFGALAATAGPVTAAQPPTDPPPADQLPGRDDVLAVTTLVHDHWIAANPDPGDNSWNRSTYFSGAMAHYRLTGDARYLDYTLGWAQRHGYGFAGGAATRNADNQCAGQVYLDLYDELGGADRIAVTVDSLDRMRASAQRDDWWWVDALHMAMPLFARVGALRGDTSYWLTMYQLYHHTKRLQPDRQGRVTGLFSEWTPLWYRDNNYVIDAPAERSPAGRPVLWSRGNGWALAAHAKVLAVLPRDDKRGPEYIHTLRTMAETLRAAQRADGFWNPNLADPEHFGSPETSGTAFFAYGMAYGINAGLLDRATFLPVVARAWNGLVATAVRADGFLGYVQGIGLAPAQVRADQTADFGVGAFLLAGSEIAALTG